MSPTTIRQRSFSTGTQLHTVGGNLKMKLDDKRTAKLGLNANRYKTEMCRPFQEYGCCKYGDKCQFAHGTLELRALPRHPKYKTELCRTFHSHGYCPYGTRCHFVHTTGEARPAPLTITRTLSGNGSVPTTPTYPLSILPPLSPSQDSGISSPDDTASFFLAPGNKFFDFPLSDSSSDDTDPEIEPLSNNGSTLFQQTSLVNDSFNDWDSNSLDSPIKPTVGSISSTIDPTITQRLSSISLDLDDGLYQSLSHSRLPVFDSMNSYSDSALDKPLSNIWK